MGLPLILYDLVPVVNSSFETDADGVFPTGWVDTKDNKAETDTAQFFKRGSSEGVKSLLMDSLGTAGKSVRQDIVWVPPVGTAVGCVGMVRGSNVDDVFRIQVQFKSASVIYDTATIDPTIISAGVWQPWLVPITNSNVLSDRIRFILPTFVWTTSVDFWFDYIHIGRALDFAEMPFNAITVSNSFRSNLATGAGAYEAVELGDPQAHITATIARVTKDSQLETDLLAFLGYTRGHRKFAFWLDRDDHTNQGKHFAECILDDVVVLGERAGANGRTFQLRFTAPLEWMPQEVD